MVIDPVTIGAGATVSAPIIQSVLESAANRLARLKVLTSEKLRKEFQIGFSHFLTASYNKCFNLKTLINRDAPIPLTKAYVNLTLKCEDEIIHDIDLIDQLESYHRIAITGLAGAGKSMFMKYLTISRFENPKTKIPLFVELKNINNLSTKDILEYTFQSCATARVKVSKAVFESSLAAGV